MLDGYFRKIESIPRNSCDNSAQFILQTLGYMFPKETVILIE